MKALEVIVVDIFLRLSVFMPFVLGVVELTTFWNFGASPYGSYATFVLAFKVFRFWIWTGMNSDADIGSEPEYAKSWFKLWLWLISMFCKFWIFDSVGKLSPGSGIRRLEFDVLLAFRFRTDWVCFFALLLNAYLSALIVVREEVSPFRLMWLWLLFVCIFSP